MAGPPFIARMWLESTAAREKSSRSAARSSESSSSCRRCQTPASFQSRSLPADLSPLNALPSLSTVFFGMCEGPVPGPLDLSSPAGRPERPRLTVEVGTGQVVTGTRGLGPGIRVRYL
ncbi:hypothetical protein [Streptomyces sp. MK37H]|uniref:hypothetical protein n=1 Tax=Streptomyces sp. MK37H TaxID=2699117 RepID=UPI0035A8FCDB